MPFKFADAIHNANIDVKTADIDTTDVPDAAADVAAEVASANVVDVHDDANVADVDAANVPDACNGSDVADAAKGLDAPTDVAGVAADNVADAAGVGDDLQNAIERLQVYWGPGSHHRGNDCRLVPRSQQGHRDSFSARRLSARAAAYVTSSALLS